MVHAATSSNASCRRARSRSPSSPSRCSSNSVRSRSVSSSRSRTTVAGSRGGHLAERQLRARLVAGQHGERVLDGDHARLGVGRRAGGQRAHLGVDGVRVGRPRPGAPARRRTAAAAARSAARRAQRGRQQSGHLGQAVEGPAAALHPRQRLLQRSPGGVAAGLAPRPDSPDGRSTSAGRAGPVGLGRPHPGPGVVELGLHPAHVGAEGVEQRGVLGLRGARRRAPPRRRRRGAASPTPVVGGRLGVLLEAHGPAGHLGRGLREALERASRRAARRRGHRGRRRSRAGATRRSEPGELGVRGRGSPRPRPAPASERASVSARRGAASRSSRRVQAARTARSDGRGRQPRRSGCGPPSAAACSAAAASRSAVRRRGLRLDLREPAGPLGYAGRRADVLRPRLGRPADERAEPPRPVPADGGRAAGLSTTSTSATATAPARRRPPGRASAGVRAQHRGQRRTVDRRRPAGRCRAGAEHRAVRAHRTRRGARMPPARPRRAPRRRPRGRRPAATAARPGSTRCRARAGAGGAGSRSASTCSRRRPSRCEPGVRRLQARRRRPPRRPAPPPGPARRPPGRGQRACRARTVAGAPATTAQKRG